MEEDYSHGFKLAAYLVPCCGNGYNLNQLAYEWPEGFGRFAFEAMNPGIGELEESRKLELEETLGSKLRVIYRHV
jgi:hypothetical protein